MISKLIHSMIDIAHILWVLPLASEDEEYAYRVKMTNGDVFSISQADYDAMKDMVSVGGA